jgi:hypothetical protein
VVEHGGRAAVYCRRQHGRGLGLGFLEATAVARSSGDTSVYRRFGRGGAAVAPPQRWAGVEGAVLSSEEYAVRGEVDGRKKKAVGGTNPALGWSFYLVSVFYMNWRN